MGNTERYVAHNCPGFTEIRITGLRITKRPLCTGQNFRTLLVFLELLTVVVERNTVRWICAAYGNNNVTDSIVSRTGIIIIIIIIFFMQGIYTYIPVTNYVPRE